MITRYYFQDGAEFYLFADGSCKGEPLGVARYPNKVLDFDWLEAIAAHKWFIEKWCPTNLVNPVQCVA